MNRLFDRIRSPAAAEAATRPGEGGRFDSLAASKYALLVTFKRSGDPVPTPIWFGLDDDGRLYVRTEADSAKVRRVRRDAHVRVGACDVRGKPRGPMIEGRARVVASEEEEHAERALQAHYGLGRRIYEGTAGAVAGEMAYIEVTPAGEEEPA
jgi:uncharacterized protein